MEAVLLDAAASVAMTGIDRSAAPEVLAKGAPDPVPALLLGRLAVDHRYSSLGIGTTVAAHVPGFLPQPVPLIDVETSNC